MKNSPLASLLSLTLLMTAGCGGDDNTTPSGDELPWETKWTTVVDQLPFPLDGDGKISALTVGRRESDSNYANRGNIEVLFDQDQPVITIEMKIYDFSDDVTFNGDASMDPPVEGTKERMSLWAFVGGVGTPGSKDPEDDCTKDTWKSGCTVGVYYDGKAQPVRAGADLRVHIPKAYRGDLNVETEDNTGEATYPRLGNITVDGLCSSANVTLSSGTAKVKMCRELEVAPTCPAASIAMCETFKDENGDPAAWASACPCSPDLYGQVKIVARPGFAGNITVDIPTTTWMNVTARNDEPNKPNDCKPSLESCTAAANCTPMQDNDYVISGEFNYPSPAAASGAGFNLSVSSALCAPINFFEKASDWAVDAEPEQELHGFVKVCTGCL